jgi:hypothetical protein
MLCQVWPVCSVGSVPLISAGMPLGVRSDPWVTHGDPWVTRGSVALGCFYEENNMMAPALGG